LVRSKRLFKPILPYVGAVIFDASGTLVDDSLATWEAFNKFFNLCGLNSLSFETFKEKFCLPCSSFLVKMDVPEKAMREFPMVFNQLYLESLNRVKLFADVKECLLALRRSSIKLGLVSATPSELLWPALEKLRLPRFFKLAIGNAPKPSPLPIYQACEVIGTSPEHAVYVGDMEQDVICAKRAGAVSIGICRENGSYHDRNRLEAQNPSYVISDLEELLSLVAKV